MTNAEKIYGDIIRRERPVDEEVMSKYPRMPVEARAKIFSPFAALRGHKERLDEETNRAKLQERTELSEDEAETLNNKILSLKRNDEITLTYFEAEDGTDLGVYKTVNCRVVEIDEVFGKIKTEPTEEETSLFEPNTITIDFNDLYEIKTEQ